MKIHETVETCNINEYVKKEAVSDYPKMTDSASTAFRRFTGIKHDGYNLVRKGNRIFSVGSTVAKCVYNHSRVF